MKKSPTGSALTHRPLKRNSAATGKETQRGRIKRLIDFSVFNVKAGFSARTGAQEKEKFLCTEILASLSERIMQPEQLRCIAIYHGKDFGVIVVRNADWRRDPKRFEQVRHRVAMSDAVSCVRLNSVTNRDRISESFRICANASARFCPWRDKSGSLPPVLAFSA